MKYKQTLQIYSLIPKPNNHPLCSNSVTTSLQFPLYNGTSYKVSLSKLVSDDGILLSFGIWDGNGSGLGKKMTSLQLQHILQCLQFIGGPKMEDAIMFVSHNPTMASRLRGLRSPYSLSYNYVNLVLDRVSSV